MPLAPQKISEIRKVRNDLRQNINTQAFIILAGKNYFVAWCKAQLMSGEMKSHVISYTLSLVYTLHMKAHTSRDFFTIPQLILVLFIRLRSLSAMFADSMETKLHKSQSILCNVSWSLTFSDDDVYDNVMLNTQTI